MKKEPSTLPRLLERDGFWFFALALSAGFSRVCLLLSNRDQSWPFSIFYQGDTRTFYDAAFAMLRGLTYDAGLPFHPPAFPAFLAGMYWACGADVATGQVPHFAVRVLLAGMGGLSIGLLYLLCRPWLDRPAAVVTALLASFHFGLSVLSIAPNSEGFYFFLMLVALLLWTRYLPHGLSLATGVGSRWAGFLLGLVLGVLTLTRAEGMLFSGLLLGIGLLGLRKPPVKKGSQASWKERLAPWLLVGLGWLLVVTPWAVRNFVVLGQVNQDLSGQVDQPFSRFVPVTLYGPLNLALANHADADGRFSPARLPEGRTPGRLRLEDPQHMEFLLHGDRMAWEWIRAHPGDFARLTWERWGFSLAAFRLGWTQWDWPGGLQGSRQPVDIFLPDSNWGLLSFPLVLLGCLWMLVQGGRLRSWVLLMLLPSLGWLLTTGLFFGYARLALLVLPFWLSGLAMSLVLAGRGLARILPQLNTPRAKRRLWGLAFGAWLLLLGLEFWGSGAERNFEASGPTLEDGRINPDAPVELKLLSNSAP